MAVYMVRPELVRATRRVRLAGWEKDDKGDQAPVVEDAANGNLLFITDADGKGGGEEWLDAMTRAE